ncbi:hypothetical protein AVDCRST_MAG94-162 [uncultured Leptolyngbya sp.]|uniref:Uncharacterized protein n=1 Tax=uncultured Leptolyngbya sp. TaxID=332963 RepID=A0A6J4K7Q7_9CYAN|nr:hypothetical protein AVDCRST_MAG94-162 [uncultured Leptolyngbya sp.]
MFYLPLLPLLPLLSLLTFFPLRSRSNYNQHVIGESWLKH